MRTALIERLVIICTFVIFLLAYTWRAYRNSTEAGRSAIIKLVLFAGLTLLPSAALIPALPGWLKLFLQTFPPYYGALFAYLAMDQFLNNKQYQPIIENKLFVPVSIMCAIAFAMGVLLGDNRTEFISDADYYNHWLQYAFTFFNYFIIIYILINIVNLYKSSFIFSTSDTKISTRCFFCVICCIVGTIGFVLVELNLFIYVTYHNDTYRSYLNQAYNICRIASSLLLEPIPKLSGDRQ